MPLQDEAEEAREPLILRKARTRERARKFRADREGVDRNHGREDRGFSESRASSLDACAATSTGGPVPTRPAFTYSAWDDGGVSVTFTWTVANAEWESEVVTF